MRRYPIGVLLLILTGTLILWAATTDLRPDADVQIAWAVFGDGTGDCASSTAEYGCINSDVESPEDSTYIRGGTTVEGDGATQEWTFQNSPGDCVSVTSVTLKLRALFQDTNDDDDRVDVTLEVGGTTSGSTHCFSANDSACDCDLTTALNFENCSITDSAWDALSCTDIDNLSGVAVFTENNTGMPDDTNFRISEAEILLDYSNVASTGRKRRIIKLE